MIGYIKNAVNEKINSGILKRARGQIVELLDDGYRAKVTVNNNTHTFLNKSGEELAVGDTVTIHYWTNISNGYIALRHGLPNPLSGTYCISDAIVVDDNTEYGYVDNQHTITAKNNVVKQYGSDRSLIYLNGYPVTYMPANVYRVIAGVSTDRTILTNFVSNTASDRFYKEIVLKSPQNESQYSDDTAHDITYYASVNSKKYNNADWETTYGLYQSNPDIYWYYSASGSITYGKNTQGGDTYQGIKSTLITSDVYTDSIAYDDVGIALYYNGNMTIGHTNQYADFYPYALINIIMALKVGNDVYTYNEIQGNFVSESEYNYARNLTEIKYSKLT